MFVNASSTLVESNADVSINAKLFLSLKSIDKQKYWYMSTLQPSCTVKYSDWWQQFNGKLHTA